MSVTPAQFGRRVDQLEILYDLTSAMALAARSEDVYEPALDALFRGTSCTRAAILLFDADNVMRFTASRGLSEAYRREVEGHTPWSPVTRAPRPIVIQDVETDEELHEIRDTIRQEGIRGLTFIPLTTEHSCSITTPCMPSARMNSASPRRLHGMSRSRSSEAAPMSGC